MARLFRATLCSVQRRLGICLGRRATLSDALDAMLEHCFEAWGLREQLHAHNKYYRSHGGDDADEKQAARGVRDSSAV